MDATTAPPDVAPPSPAPARSDPSTSDSTPHIPLSAAGSSQVIRLVVRDMLHGNPLPRVGLVVEDDLGLRRRLEADELGYVQWSQTRRVRRIDPSDSVAWTCLQTAPQAIAEGTVWLAALAPLEVGVAVEGPGSTLDDADQCRVDLVTIGKIDPLTATARDPWSKAWMDQHARTSLPTLPRTAPALYRAMVPRIAGVAVRVVHPECHPVGVPLPAASTSTATQRIDVTLVRLRTIRWQVLGDDDRPLTDVELLAQVHLETADHDEWRRQLALAGSLGGVAATGRPAHYSITFVRAVRWDDQGFYAVLPSHLGRTVLSVRAPGHHSVMRDVGPDEDTFVVRPRRSRLPRIELTWRSRSIGPSVVTIVDVTESPLQHNFTRNTDERGELPGETLEEGRAYLVSAGGFDATSLGLEVDGLRGFVLWRGGNRLEFMGLPDSIEVVVPK